MSHLGALLCVPSGIYGWHISDLFSILQKRPSNGCLQEQDDIEVLLVGTGTDLRPLSPDLKSLFREASILADPMSTGAAIRTFNVLLSEDRAVAAALLPVD